MGKSEAISAYIQSFPKNQFIVDFEALERAKENSGHQQTDFQRFLRTHRATESRGDLRVSHVLPIGLAHACKTQNKHVNRANQAEIKRENLERKRGFR